ncbi:unnamed protein product [Pleuronectes platessa]|uniref:Uncharacterized protein n=1 Tax=Pleuronectes platessa TaxID=8262 RepID=A0A9N7UD44_PLEPL|nr:unnamed protein product [Pleuronectes platessa]
MRLIQYESSEHHPVRLTVLSVLDCRSWGASSSPLNKDTTDEPGLVLIDLWSLTLTRWTAPPPPPAGPVLRLATTASAGSCSRGLWLCRGVFSRTDGRPVGGAGSGP